MLASLPAELLRALRLTIVMAVLTGLLYPLAITGIAQVLFKDQANGSLITDKSGAVIGSRLIGQSFQGDSRYFYGRPSATPTPYDASNSAGSNLGPSNQALSDRVAGDVQRIQSTEFGVPGDGVPVDLVTTDFTGFDPDISVAAAMLQSERVARVRGLDPAKVRQLIDHHTQGRVLWIFGEPHVNVLDVNLALDNGEAG